MNVPKSMKTQVAKALGTFGVTVEPRSLAPTTTKRTINLPGNVANRGVLSDLLFGWLMT